MRASSLPLLASIALSLSCAAGPAPAERARADEESAVLGAVQRFCDTMTSRDAAGARAVLDPEGDFVSVRWTADGEPLVRRASNRDYLEGLGSATETLQERIREPEVRIHGPIATVWTPYEFYVDGQFSHGGVDAFQLLRTEAGWIITGGIYTVERPGREARASTLRAPSSDPGGESP